MLIPAGACFSVFTKSLQTCLPQAGLPACRLPAVGGQAGILQRCCKNSHRVAKY